MRVRPYLCFLLLLIGCFATAAYSASAALAQTTGATAGQPRPLRDEAAWTAYATLSGRGCLGWPPAAGTEGFGPAVEASAGLVSPGQPVREAHLTPAATGSGSYKQAVQLTATWGTALRVGRRRLQLASRATLQSRYGAHRRFLPWNLQLHLALAVKVKAAREAAGE